ncbi:hypothetical protein INR49_028345, partial [Caranx melampygus]
MCSGVNVVFHPTLEILSTSLNQGGQIEGSQIQDLVSKEGMFFPPLGPLSVSSQCKRSCHSSVRAALWVCPPYGTVLESAGEARGRQPAQHPVDSPEVTIVPAADLQSEHSLVPQPQPKYTESGSGATGKHQQAHGAALQPFSSSSDTSLHILFLLVPHRLLLPSALLLQRKSAVGNLHLVCEMLPVDWSILFFLSSSSSPFAPSSPLTLEHPADDASSSRLWRDSRRPLA